MSPIYLYVSCDPYTAWYIERFYGGTAEDSDILEESVEESDTETITTEEVVERLMED